MNVREIDAANTVKNADEICQRSFIEYNSLKEAEAKNVLDPKTLQRKKTALAQNMALAAEYYIKGILLSNLEITLPDEMKTFVETQSGTSQKTSAFLSPEEQHLLLTKKWNDIVQFMHEGRETERLFPTLSILYDNGHGVRDNPSTNRLKNLAKALEKYNFFKFGHDVHKGVEALTGEELKDSDLVKIKNAGGRSAYSEILDGIIDRLFSKALIEVFEYQEENDGQTEEKMDIAYASESKEVREGFPQGRYATICLFRDMDNPNELGNYYYVADMDTLFDIMMELNLDYGQLNPQALRMRLGESEKSPIHHFSTDRNTQVVERNVFDANQNRSLDGGNGIGATVNQCKEGTCFDYVSDHEPMRVMCIGDRVEEVNPNRSLTHDQLQVIYDTLVDSRPKSPREADLETEIKNKNDELAKVRALNAKNQEMLGKALGFMQTVKDSKLGKFWFRKEFKALDAPSNDQNER